ncbi:MAG: dihydrofolate reductase [Candidatus Nealsonbacteria bacterium]|nr:dihydrofolate reductase [Candidatus Nealsonbacteria bacterium]
MSILKKDKTVISIIVAMGNGQVIGINNNLPWNLPADMEHFKKLTRGKPIIMGQKTFESIGKPLPGRRNIILTLDKNYQAPGCLVVYSIEEALEKTREFEEVMICGGASVYSQFIPLADRMYLTLIEGDFEGDAFFPEFDRSEWRESERINNEPDRKNPYKYSFVILERKYETK